MLGNPKKGHPSYQSYFHSSIHSSISLFFLSLIHPFTLLSTHPFILPLIYSFLSINPPIYSFMHSSTRSSISLFILSLIHSFTLLSTHPLILLPIHSSTHPSTHPLIECPGTVKSKNSQTGTRSLCIDELEATKPPTEQSDSNSNFLLTELERG